MTLEYPKRLRSWLWLVAGICASAAVAQPAADAPPAASQDEHLIVLTAAVAPDRDALWVLDREARRLCVYRFENSGMTLAAVRAIAWDFRYSEFPRPPAPRQDPPVLAMWGRAQPPPVAAPGRPNAAPAVQPPPARPIGSLIMVKGRLENGRDAAYVLDSTNRKLAAYTTDGRTLSLRYVRDLQADLHAVQFQQGPAQAPPVKAWAPGGPALPPAGAGGAGPHLVALTAALAPDRDALWVLDRDAQRLAVYRVDNESLTVVAVRAITTDFHLYEFPDGRQTPAVRDVQRAAAGPGAPGAAPAPLRPPAPQPIGALVMTKGALETGRDAVHVLDSANRKLAVYTTDGKTLTLHDVRDLEFDLQMFEYPLGSQSPSVNQVRRDVGP